MANAIIKIDTNSGEDTLAQFVTAGAATTGIQVVRECLEVGDVRIEVTAGASSSVLLIERKTWSDLQSSLRDGRYKEQKARQMRAVADGQGTLIMTYIVESQRVHDWTSDGTSPPRGGVTAKQVDAAIAMTCVRDGIPVLRAANTEHTADLVLYLTKKLAAGELSGSSHAVMASAAGYAGFVKSTKKRANMDNGTTWQTMLSTITGVSAKKAKHIADTYATPTDLCVALSNANYGDERDKLLAEIKCGDKRLGNALAKRIADTFSSHSAAL